MKVFTPIIAVVGISGKSSRHNPSISVRALLFDLKGNLVAKSRVPLESYFSDHPGWAEQHPEITGHPERVE